MRSTVVPGARRYIGSFDARGLAMTVPPQSGAQDAGLGNRYFVLGGFYESSPISDLHFRYRIPRFRCSECGNDEFAFHLGYPHLDPAEVLSPDELKLIDGRKPKIVDDPGILFEIARRLERHWHVPVTSGAHFLPLRIKATSRPRYDFDVLTFGSDFFIRRHAAERLLSEGFDFEYVPADAYGNRAQEADFVQCLVPIVAHCQLPPGATFCDRCHRASRPVSARPPTWLLESSAIRERPFFFALEVGFLYASVAFVEAAQRLLLKGLIDGKTLLGVTARGGLEDQQTPLTWQGLKGVGHRAAQRSIPKEQ